MKGLAKLSRKADKDTRKERILKEALKLFSQQGFHATTTKEIAAASGVAEGLIFYYFGDKRKLLLEIVRSFTFLLHLQESAKQLPQLPLAEALVQYGIAYLQFLHENYEYLLLIWSPEMFQDEEVSREVNRLLAKMGAAGGALLEQGLGEGSAEDGSYEIAMAAFTSSLLVHYMMSSRFRDRPALPFDEEAYVRKLVHLLLHGLTHPS